MTDERSLDRALERAAQSWIEEGPTRAPDRPVEAALALIQTTNQERDLRIPWRLPNMNLFARLATVAAVVVVAGAALLMLRPGGDVGGPPPSPEPTTSPSPKPTTFLSPETTESPGLPTLPPGIPTPAPVSPATPLDTPPGESLPADLLGRTYVADPPESHREPGQITVLTLRPADDPHCAAMYDGESTCFTYLWTPNWPKHQTDAGARGTARIVDGNLVLRFDIVPSDPECEGESATYLVDDEGATLAGVDAPACTVPGFREQ
jgi:hypothetical protein